MTVVTQGETEPPAEEPTPIQQLIAHIAAMTSQMAKLQEEVANANGHLSTLLLMFGAAIGLFVIAAIIFGGLMLR